MTHIIAAALPLIAYIHRTIADTMCDHNPDTPQTRCSRCSKLIQELNTLFAGISSEGLLRVQIANLQARLALAAAARLIDLFDVDMPVTNGVSTMTVARRAIDTSRGLLDNPTLGRHADVRRHAEACAELDHAVWRAARRGTILKQETFAQCFLLKAAGHAAAATAAATSAGWSTDGGAVASIVDSSLEACETASGASVGASLDGAKALNDMHKSDAMMAIAVAVWSEIDQATRTDEGLCPGCSDPNPGGLCARCTDAGAHTSDEVHGDDEDMNERDFEQTEADDFGESVVGDVADDAIAELHRAEVMLTRISNLHRKAESVGHTGPDGTLSVYLGCCVVCRDGRGRPMAWPCETERIVQGYGDA